MTICETMMQFIENIADKGRLVAFDVGVSKIGVAISDPTRIISSPHDIFIRINLKKDVNKAISYIKAYDVVGVVIGLPLNLKGEDGDSAQVARTFAAKLSKECKRPIFLQDERFTSKQSQKVMGEYGMSKIKKAAVEDKIAASFILQAVIVQLNPLDSE